MNKGMITTTDALKSAEDIAKVKAVLKHDPRGYALFVTAINVALRATDLLSIKKGDIRGNELFLRERKTKKLRKILLNQQVLDAINAYLATRADNMEWVFVGQRGKITYGYFSAMIKRWFAEAGIGDGRWATHSLRKSFTRMNYERGVPLATLMVILNHSSERQVLTYCGITGEDVAKVYQNAI